MCRLAPPLIVLCCSISAASISGCRRGSPESRADTTPESQIRTTSDEADSSRDRNGWRDDRDTDDAARTSCSLLPIFFTYDEHTLDEAARDRLGQNAACIRANQPTKVAITGMCDPRGTTEYNLALGDRRANSVTKQLNVLGIKREILSPRSVGKEFAEGTDEASWALDRRVDSELLMGR